jgi:nesprin-1
VSEFAERLADPIKICSSAAETYKVLQEHMVRVHCYIFSYLSTQKNWILLLERKIVNISRVKAGNILC